MYFKKNAIIIFFFFAKKNKIIIIDKIYNKRSMATPMLIVIKFAKIIIKNVLQHIFLFQLYLTLLRTIYMLQYIFYLKHLIS